jgi:hypothetical protein
MEEPDDSDIKIMKIGICDTLMLLAGKGVTKELTAFGKKNNNSEMIAQAAQLETYGRLLDAAMLTSTVFSALCWVYSNDTTRYYICTTIAGGSTTLLLYVSKKMYDSAYYIQNALNKYPVLRHRMITKCG